MLIVPKKAQVLIMLLEAAESHQSSARFVGRRLLHKACRQKAMPMLTLQKFTYNLILSNNETKLDKILGGHDALFVSQRTLKVKIVD
jgi:hypothetical protein